MTALRGGRGVSDAVQVLTKTFGSFAATANADTAVIEAHVDRLLQIVTGTYKQGVALFAGIRWAA